MIGLIAPLSLFIHCLLIEYDFGLHIKLFLPACRSNLNYSQYIQSSTRSDLFCPRKLQEEICELYFKKRACACNAVPNWIIHHSTVLSLQLEYIDLKGSSVLSYNGARNTKVRLSHQNGILTKMPGNYCHFPTMVEMLLSRNRLTTIGDISCLQELDFIDLSYNRISEVSNQTFRKMKKLRVIDLSYNRIRRIEPFSFAQDGLNPLKINLSNNVLVEIDFSNVFMPKIFCLAVYSNNNINKITNELGCSINSLGYERTHTFGGFIDLSYNHINYLPDPYIFGLKSMQAFGGMLLNHFWTHFNRNRFVCDCNLAFELKGTMPIIKHYHLGAYPFGLFCSSPPEMTSFDMDNFDNGQLSKFQCKSKKCPGKCSCIYIIVTNQIIIDCSKAKISKIIDIDLSYTSWNLLYFDVIRQFEEADIQFLLSGNSFKDIPNISSVLNRTKFLDLSRNKIHNLQKILLESIPTDAYVNLSYNDGLKTLPKIVTRFDINKINLNGLLLECNCGDVNKMYKWLPDFLKSESSSENRAVHCNTNGGIVDARIVTWNYLGCEDNLILDNKIIFIAFVLLILSVCFLVLFFVFRFEIFITYRKLRQKECTNKPYMYDIYISMDNENETLLRWMLHKFCPSLENRGYKAYLPPRDMGGGCFKEELIREAIEMSRCFLVFLTAPFARGKDEWMALEWRKAWQQSTVTYDRKIIIINYDQIRYRDVVDKTLQKYLRWGTCIDFCTRGKFLQSCKKEIGKPCVKSRALDIISKSKRKYLADNGQVKVNLQKEVLNMVFSKEKQKGRSKYGMNT